MKTFGIMIATAVGLVFLWLIFIVPFVGWHIQTGNGEHTGFITAAETTGLFFKTHTVYLKTDTQSSQEDAYCVIDNEIFNQLKGKVEKKEQVTVQYMGYLSAGIANCDGEGEIITALK